MSRRAGFADDHLAGAGIEIKAEDDVAFQSAALDRIDERRARLPGQCAARFGRAAAPGLARLSGRNGGHHDAAGLARLDRDISKPRAIGRPGGRNIVIGIVGDFDALADREIAHIDLALAGFRAGGIGERRAIGRESGKIFQRQGGDEGPAAFHRPARRRPQQPGSGGGCGDDATMAAATSHSASGCACAPAPGGGRRGQTAARSRPARPVRTRWARPLASSASLASVFS